MTLPYDYTFIHSIPSNFCMKPFCAITHRIHTIIPYKRTNANSNRNDETFGYEAGDSDVAQYVDTSFDYHGERRLLLPIDPPSVS